MKRFFAFLLLAVAFSSCDDGDLTQVSFEFNDNPAVACNTDTGNFFIYKTQDNRALIIQIPETKFLNKVSADQATQPLPLNIDGSTVRLIYREYSGKVTNKTLCSAVPASDPVVITEREATGGTITITTSAITSEPDANGVTKITNFRHALVFRDIKFDLGNGNSQVNESISQVVYLTEATAFTPFSGLTGLQSCENDNSFLFKFEDDQALVLDLSEVDAAYLFTSDEGPKTRLISADNKLTHLFFNITNVFLNNDYFCANPTPTAPPILDTFTAANGVDGQSGIIEVTTLASDNGFKHTIVLKKVKLVKGSLKKELGDAFILGQYETITPVQP